MPTSKADVVDLSAHEVLTRLGKETEKWNGWKINWRRWLHVLHHLSQVQIEGLIAGTHKVVAVKVPEVARNLKKLVFETTITVLATAEFVTRDFFKMGQNGVVKIWMSERFQEVILAKASERISRGDHTLDVLKLSDNMYDSAIRHELGEPKAISVDEYLSSIKTRIEMWAKKQEGHGLLDNGYANIEYVDVGDRIVVVYCDFGGSKWYFYCFELDECGVWGAGCRVSSLAA